MTIFGGMGGFTSGKKRARALAVPVHCSTYRCIRPDNGCISHVPDDDGMGARSRVCDTIIAYCKGRRGIKQNAGMPSARREYQYFKSAQVPRSTLCPDCWVCPTHSTSTCLNL